MANLVERMRRKFTLIELLVVVAIIGILASMLMPSLAAARGKAKTSVCLGQLKQLGTSFIMYADSNDENFIDRILGGPDSFWMARLYDFHESEKIIQCTSVQHSIKSGWYWGGKDSPWGCDSGWMVYNGINARGSVGINSFLYSTENDTNDEYFYSYAEIEETGNTPIFSDSVWVDHWPRSGNGNPTDLNGGNDSSLHRVFMDRHYGKKTNHVFVDNSARTRSIGTLLQLDWHKDMTHRAVPVP